MSLIDTLKALRPRIAAWAQRVPAWAEGHPVIAWAAAAVKTALTHALVRTLALAGGVVLFLLSVVVLGVRPLWAAAWITLGVDVGAWFYIDREREDVQKEGWRAKADAFLDVALPWIVVTLELYALGWFWFMSLGHLL